MSKDTNKDPSTSLKKSIENGYKKLLTPLTEIVKLPILIKNQRLRREE